MSVNVQEQVASQPPVEQKAPEGSKEYNFAQIRKQLEAERAARQQAEEKAKEYEKIVQSQKQSHDDDDDDSDEPYVDKRRLKKELTKVVQKTYSDTDAKIQTAVQQALAEERRNQWMKNNPDFAEVMSHAQKFAEKDPELAETILEMPDTFERQKLVYKNIKALGLHKKEEPKTSIQDTINDKRRSYYYQPSDVASAPYAATGDFSDAGQKSSYAKMKELQKRMGLGG